MKIYLDDTRTTPEGWIRCYWPDEVIEFLKTGKVDVVSLDHDLGDDIRGTGRDVVNWIEEAVATTDFISPEIHIHSANGPGRAYMEAAKKSINRFIKRRIRNDVHK